MEMQSLDEMRATITLFSHLYVYRVVEVTIEVEPYSEEKPAPANAAMAALFANAKQLRK